MTQAEKTARLRLIRTETVGPGTFRALIARYGSAEAAIAAVPELARRGGRSRPLRIPSKAEAEREMQAIAAHGAELLLLGDHAYPKLLMQIEDAPPAILAKGALSLLERATLAIVGARNASSAGRHMAQSLARSLGSADLAIVSGLARGIDTAAHQGALESGTIAVVAGGIDVFYPRENEALQRAIAERGLLISEEPLGVQPTARHFPKRNRIISGLSLGVLVIEAAERSGSLITARLAGEQGREVFAVPGSPLDPRTRGTNSLLKAGAHLVETADDVTDILSGLAPPVSEPVSGGWRAPPAPEAEIPEGAHDALLELLSFTPTRIDDLARDSGLPAGVVLAVLLELEIAGRIERLPGARAVRSSDES
ncbi:MAG: DNA-processing protein DprA [Rhodothalassiaceae bacterium]